MTTNQEGCREDMSGQLRRVVDFVVGALGLVVLLCLGPLVWTGLRVRCQGNPLMRTTHVGRDRRLRRQTRGAAGEKRRILLPGRSIQVWRFRWSPDGEFPGMTNRWLALVLGWPMVWNLLKGEVSLFGPSLVELETFLYLKAKFPAEVVAPPSKPGILGLSQLDDDHENVPGMLRRKMQLDREYLMRRSVWLDMKILMFSLLEFLPGASG